MSSKVGGNLGIKGRLQIAVENELKDREIDWFSGIFVVKFDGFKLN